MYIQNVVRLSVEVLGDHASCHRSALESLPAAGKGRLHFGDSQLPACWQRGWQRGISDSPGVPPPPSQWDLPCINSESDTPSRSPQGAGLHAPRGAGWPPESGLQLKT